MKILVATGPNKDLTRKVCEKLSKEGVQFDLLSVYGDTYPEARTFTETLITESYDEIWILPGCPFPKRQLDFFGKTVQKTFEEVEDGDAQGEQDFETGESSESYDRVFKPKRRSPGRGTQVEDSLGEDNLPF